MPVDEIFSVDLSVAPDRRKLNARIKRDGRPFDVLGKGTVPARVGAVRLSVEELPSVPDQIPGRAQAVTRHFVNVLGSLASISFRDHGEVIFDFAQVLTEEHVSKLKEQLPRQLVVIVPMSELSSQ